MDCVFCKIIKGELPSKVLYEDDLVIAIMDINPLVDGHTLIIPKKHYTDYTELDSEIILHIYKIAKELDQKIMEKLGAKSSTLLVNYGDDQQVKHFHLHILPDLGVESESRAKRTVDENFNLIMN